MGEAGQFAKSPRARPVSFFFDFVAFGDQDAPNRKQRIEVAHQRSRSNENFYAIPSL
jgi:hypothetical protein